MKVDIETLKKEIDAKGLNTISLAKQSGLDKSTISRLLNEERSCSIATAQSIVSALGLSAIKAGKIFFSK